MKVMLTEDLHLHCMFYMFIIVGKLESLFEIEGITIQPIQQETTGI